MRAAALITALALLTGCAGSTTEPRIQPSIEARGLVWAAGSTIHLGDGSTLGAGTPIRSFVVAPDGAYVVPDMESDDRMAYAELLRVLPTSVEPVDSHPEPDSLELSPDGRYLGFIDRSGRADDYRTPLAEAVVIDLQTGDEVLRSSAGMGDIRVDDLADLYEEVEPLMLGIGEERAYFATTDDVRSVDLDSGDVDVVGDRGALHEGSWRAGLRRPSVAGSPDGAWSIREQGRSQQIVSADGAVVETRLTASDVGIAPLDPEPQGLSWLLDSWVDNTTAAGTAVVRASLDGSETRVLITCTVPDGACSAVPGTEDGVLLPEDRRVVVPRPLR